MSGKARRTILLDRPARAAAREQRRRQAAVLQRQAGRKRRPGARAAMQVGQLDQAGEQRIVVQQILAQREAFACETAVFGCTFCVVSSQGNTRVRRCGPAKQSQPL